MRERRTYGSVRGLRREPLVYSTIGNLNSAAKRNCAPRQGRVV